jgi:chorismate mutase
MLQELKFRSNSEDFLLTKTKYRNIPEWQIPIELQNKFPDLPLFIDPSHITGNREMILEVTQEALDLNYDGMIIETHIDQIMHG